VGLWPTHGNENRGENDDLDGIRRNRRSLDYARDDKLGSEGHHPQPTHAFVISTGAKWSGEICVFSS
jgi:hypothetical protein